MAAVGNAREQPVILDNDDELEVIDGGSALEMPREAHKAPRGARQEVSK